MEVLFSTSLSIDWHDCGLCAGDSIVREQIMISRSKGLITIKQYDGSNTLLVKTEVSIQEDAMNDFFLYIDYLCQNRAWEPDYSVQVCDGFAWEMVVRFGRTHRQKITGTVELPPHGMSITRKILGMLENTHCLVIPRVFGFDCEDDGE